MPIDVVSTIEIRRPRDQVAAFLADPANDHRWIRALAGPAERLTEGDFGPGTRVRRRAKMAGRTIDYTTQIIEYRPGELTVMDTIDGPFPMRVTYSLAGTNDGTIVTVRNQGGKGALFAVFGWLVARMVRSRVDRDLQILKRLLESPPDDLSGDS